MQFKIFLVFAISCCKVCAQENLPQLQTQQDVQGVNTDKGKHTFSLIFPDSELTESFYIEPANGQLTVEGSSHIYYPDTMANSVVDYVADKNGYRASYKISKEGLPLPDEFSIETRLTNSSLKSLAG